MRLVDVVDEIRQRVCRVMDDAQRGGLQLGGELRREGMLSGYAGRGARTVIEAGLTSLISSRAVASLEAAS